MREFVWFFGQSASGKRTLIEAIAAGQADSVRHRVGAKEPIVVCEESFVGELLGTERQGLLRSLEQRREEATFLVKGQDVDVQRKLPQLLRASRPDSAHKVVLLWADLAVVHTRWEKRDAHWQGRAFGDVINDLNDHMVNVVTLYDEGFPFVCVDCTTDQCEVMSWDEFNAKWDLFKTIQQ